MSVAADVHRAMFDAVQHRNWDRLRSVLHSDYTYIATDGTETAGAEAALAVAQTYTTAFPDLRFALLHQHAVGDCSIIELRATGTHDGPLEGMAPTGRKVTLTGCNVVEVQNGKILREREYFDTGALMTQLGATGGPAAADGHRAAVREIYDAFGRGDVEAIIDRLAVDVRWDVDIPHWGLPWYEARSGRESVREFFTIVAKELDFHVFEPLAMMTDDDRVAAMIRFELTVRSTGKKVADTEVHVWRFDGDGKVASLSHIVDQHSQLLAFEGARSR